MKHKIELSLSVIVIAFAVFLVTSFVRSGLAPWDHPVLPKVARPGEMIPAIAGLGSKPGEMTLVIAMRNGCEYCEASMPFYTKLAALSDQHALKARLLAVLPDDVAATRNFLSEHGLAVPYDAGVSLPDIDVPGTPTLILADSSRRILRVWVGELTSLGQQQVLQAIASAPQEVR